MAGIDNNLAHRRTAPASYPTAVQSEREMVSVLFDGQSESAECQIPQAQIKQLVDNENTRTQWSTYQLIGAVLRSEDDLAATASGGDSLADKVRAEIAAEPTILAPRAKSRPKYLQPIAGLALAASVAGLAVVGIQQMSSDSIQQGEPLSVANITAAEQVLSPVNVVQDTPELVVDLEEHQRRLNSYLVNFNEQRTRLGMPGVNPYVRIVGFESEK